MNIVIIGSGLQALRRSEAINTFSEDKILGYLGENSLSLDNLINRFGGIVFSSMLEVATLDELDAVIICTPPDSHYEYAKFFSERGTHVLVEKPFSQTLIQSVDLDILSNSNSKSTMCVGFNHRFHPAIMEASNIIKSGQLGDVKFVRGIYGIGLRSNYTSEWRTNMSIAAGGQFIEQGSHLLDLACLFLGPAKKIALQKSNHLLAEEFGEDSGNALIWHENGTTSNLQTTLLQWHNRFEFEVFCTLGSVLVNGLGGSYGTESLTVFENLEGKPFTSKKIEWRGSDNS